MANSLRLVPQTAGAGPSRKADDVSRSDLSSSPSLTLSSTDSASSPHTPPTPRTPARYPSNLSVTTKNTHIRPSKNNLSPKSGKPYQYQSLEDLLRANGYRETRVFTPETERLRSAGDQPNTHSNESAESPTPTKQTPEPEAPVDADAPGVSTVGDMVVSLLTGWMPGGSGRVKDAHDHKTAGLPKNMHLPSAPKTRSVTNSPVLPGGGASLPRSFTSANRVGPAQGPGSRVPRTALTDALESALLKAQQPQGSAIRSPSFPSATVQSLRRRIQAGSPAQSVTPSSSSSTIRPSSRQRFQQPSQARLQANEGHSPIDRPHGLAPPRDTRPYLRHAASAPAVGRPSSHPRRTRTGIRPSRRALVIEGNTETWFETFSRVFSHVGAISRENLSNVDDRAAPGVVPKRLSSVADTRASRSRKRPDLVVTQHFSPTPAMASVTAVRSDAVLCRSAPSSRSGSKVRGSDSRKRGKTVSGKGKHVNGAGDIKMETPFLSPSLESTQADDPMSRLWVEDLNRADELRAAREEGDDDSDAEPPNLEDILSTYLKHNASVGEGFDPRLSISTSGSESDEPIARRQRSIRSLRAHLTNPSSNNIATPGVNGVPALPAFPLQFKTKSLTVHSTNPTPSPSSSDFNAWLDGTDWDTARGKGGSKKKRGLLPQWLMPGDNGVEEFREANVSRGRRN